MITFVQTLISGLSLGSIYALIALGYTMVYGIAKMLNFAHGDIIMVGAYAVIVAVMQLSLPPVIAILISIIVCAVLGVVIERLAYKPLRQAQPLTVLITAIGVSYLLQNVALLIFGSEQKAFPTILKLPAIKLGQVTIDGITLVTLGVTAIIMIALTLFINKTKLGKAMRAVSEDKEAAGLMGISIKPDHHHHLCHRLRAGGGCEHFLRRDLRLHQADHWRNAWYQGLHGSGLRRHRLYPWGDAGRRFAGPDRAILQNLYFHTLGGRHRLWRAGPGAGGQAHWPVGQADE